MCELVVDEWQPESFLRWQPNQRKKAMGFQHCEFGLTIHPAAMI